MPFAEQDALRAYASMINNADMGRLAPLLADDFRYTSQMVLTDIVGRQAYLDYMTEKLKITQQIEDRAVAEMAYLPDMGNRPCLVLHQRVSGKEICTVLATIEQNEVTQIDLCLVPTPQSAVRSGEHPE